MAAPCEVCHAGGRQRRQRLRAATVRALLKKILSRVDRLHFSGKSRPFQWEPNH